MYPKAQNQGLLLTSGRNQLKLIETSCIKKPAHLKLGNKSHMGRLPIYKFLLALSISELFSHNIKEQWLKK